MSRAVLYALMTVCAAGLGCCITVLNLASRFVMSQGGFVASGGPYQIAHPAPGWILAVPASILLGFLFGGISMLLSKRLGGFSLIPLVWAGLFLSLGYQFADMGLNPPGGGGAAWGWIVCASLFFPMGLAPVVGILLGRIRRRRMTARYPWLMSPEGSRGNPDPWRNVAYAACIALGAVSGVVTGFMLYRLLAG